MVQGAFSARYSDSSNNPPSFNVSRSKRFDLVPRFLQRRFLPAMGYAMPAFIAVASFARRPPMNMEGVAERAPYFDCLAVRRDEAPEDRILLFHADHPFDGAGALRPRLEVFLPERRYSVRRVPSAFAVVDIFKVTGSGEVEQCSLHERTVVHGSTRHRRHGDKAARRLLSQVV